MKNTVIGIDAGVHTGVAIYDHAVDKVLCVKTLDFWGAFNYIRENHSIDDTSIIVETPVRTAMYARQSEKGYTGGGQNRMMANAASNAREAELLADGLELIGFEVKRVRPIRRGKDAEGNKLGKITAAEVKAETGYEGSTNQHVRDAIMLIWKNRS